MPRPIHINFVAGDNVQLERALGYLSRWIASQPTTEGSHPVFAGMTLTGFNGLIKATNGVLGVTANNTTNWDMAYSRRLDYDSDFKCLVTTI